VQILEDENQGLPLGQPADQIEHSLEQTRVVSAHRMRR
jgi:hypothetical protein